LRDLEKKKSHVIIKGNEKAFSAGGDCKEVVSKDFKRSLFQYSLRSFELVHTYKIPYIAFMNGITFGGAAGYGIAPRNYRVVTEKTLFAMPETAIAFFNDNGASYFLSRLKRNVGFYISLASARIEGVDMKKLGLADYYVESEKLPELEESLVKCKNQQEIEKVLNKFSTEPPKDTEFDQILPRIDQCFDGDSVEEIIENLHLDGSDWAMKTVNILNKYSPTSLKVCHRELKLGKNLPLHDCLKMEYRMAIHHVAESDIYEGVRALLIDKDNKPNYKPKTLHEVTEDHVAKFFQSIPDGDELTFEQR
jgi:3-hydroxyisobutyryl-CoA hydrolase